MNHFFTPYIGNSDFRERIARNLTYCDWSSGTSSPAVLTPPHLEIIADLPLIAHDEYYGTGELLFARKFPDDSESLIAQLQRRKRIVAAATR